MDISRQFINNHLFWLSLGGLLLAAEMLGGS
ncbi:NfeD family protein, partial [Klebsiella pneumoniae]|nr:NfeD family protein [Klebsiella pneumoniae]